MQDYYIPLIIGVTGHRTIDVTDERLMRLISDEFAKLRQTFPDTPFVVLSPLAEGADRVVGRLALEELQAQLIVPLPLPLNEYQKDFATEQSRQEFCDFLHLAHRWFELPLQETLEEVTKPGEARNRQYARVGAYVAEHCQILIAVWDEKAAKGTGGTAEIVKWKDEGRVPEEFSSLPEGRSILDKSQQGVVIQFNPVTHKMKHRPPNGAESLPYSIFAKINEFNRDIKEYISRYGEGPVMQSKSALLTDEAGNTVIRDNASFQEIASLYAAADRLSIYYQHQDKRTISIIYSIFALALLLFGLIDLIESFVLFHVLSIPIMYVLISRTKKKAIEDKCLDYRALAEGLRVLAFWKLYGIAESVSTSYLSKHVGILSWIRQAIKGVEQITLGNRSDQYLLKKAQALDVASKLWINTQFSYFSEKKGSLARWSRRLGGISKAFFIVTWIIATTYFIYIFLGWTNKGLIDTIPIHVIKLANTITIRDGFQAALGFSGAIAVVSEAYKRRHAFEELGKQYTLAEQLFRTAQRRLQDPTEEPEKVLAWIGKEALMENGEWLWMHRNIPLEIPKG